MRWLLIFGLITRATCLVLPLATRKYSSQARSSSALFVARPQKQTSQTPIDDGVSGKKSGYSTGKRYSQYLYKRKSPFPRFKLFRRNKEEDQSSVADDSDGYDDMMNKKRSMLRRAMKAPFRVIKRLLDPPGEPGTLILVRHGESLWNANKTFTGWADPDLSPQGFREVEHAARLLLEGGYQIDLIFTSRLQRAIRSTWVILQEMNMQYMPVFKSWRLNERMYGALTGLSKREIAEQLGTELVQTWRGSLNARPPAISETNMYWPGRDRKYFDLSPDQIPATESLQDCMERAAPVWDDKIRKELRKGKNVMVVAHANTLRGLVKTIDNIGDDEIQEVAIPTGIPIIYKFDKQMNVLPPSGDRQTASQIHMRGLFLEKPGLLKEALKREEEWSTQVPGYDSTMGRTKQPMTPLERSLFKLKAERELGTWAGKFIDPNAPIEDDGNDGNAGRPMQFVEDQVWEAAMKETHTSSLSFENEDSNYSSAISNADDENDDYSENPVSPSLITTNPCVMSTLIGDIPIRTDSVLVIIRHGKTEHNKLGLFTGWEDAPLAKDGVDEAREAGKLLKLHGFEFDVVYTSWLSRAIQTAWLCMDEMDCLWLPIIKSWRLNERMYGSLTGLSKRMVAQRHGEKQFMAWRRGFKTRPPPVSSFSQHYPGNDARYQNLNDVRYSFRESLIRSIEAGKIVVRRKLPKHESLKDCMDRTIPYFTERIIPEALAQGKRVLISSSENAIRGLLMYLCEIPEDQITGLEIPNGLPLIYDLKSKCVKLLDDGTGRDPLEVYNFGKAARYLFRPCQNEDGSPDDDCDITFMSNFLTGDNEVSAEQVKVLEDIKRRVAA